MANINRVELSGNLTRDPELSVTRSGRSLLKFGLAVNEKNGERERVNFFDCVVWGPYGETMQRFLAKGQRVAVAGSLHYESWNDPKTGYKRSRVEVYVRAIDTLGPAPQKAASEYPEGAQIPLAAVPPRVPDPPQDLYDEEIPF